jgi:hypothetical protein
MKVNSGSLAAIAGLMLCCFGLPAFGQEVSVQYTGNYSTTWGNQDGDFGAGIYSANINGAPSSSGIICDDYSDQIVSGQKWNANAYQASSLNSSNIGETLFGSTIGLTGYAEVATLVSMMFGGSNAYGGITGISQAEISSAIWDITTAGGISGLDSKATALVAALKSAFNGKTSAAQAYLSSLTNLWILTPTPLTGLGKGEAQEMWTETSVPEGGAALLFLLLAGGTCFGAMFLKHRIAAIQ